MLLVSQAASGGLSGRACCSFCPPPKFSKPKPTLFSNRKSSRRTLHITLAKADGGLDSTPATKQIPSDSNPSLPLNNNPTVFVGQESVPLEGVIQFEKPNATASRLDKWGRVALLAGGDVLALILFSAIGRFSHGFSVIDFETLRTADPFIAGWTLSAYFLGGYGDDGRGMNGLSKAVLAAAKSWALGIPGLSPDLNDITGIKHIVPSQAFAKLYGIDMGTLLAFLGNQIVVQMGPGDYPGQLFMDLLIVDLQCHACHEVVLKHK